jgi:hypothetical protein
MPGAVSVFNLYNEPVTGLSVSGYSAGDIAGTSRTTPMYQPSALPKPVPRAKDPGSSAIFATGPNPVSIPWNSFTGKTIVVMPEPDVVSIDDDLVLYISTNLALVVTTRGMVLSQSVVTHAKSGERVEG